MFEIWLTPTTKRGLRRWLNGRGHVDGIPRIRFAMLKSEMAETLPARELMILIDETGYGLLDAMMGRQVSAG